MSGFLPDIASWALGGGGGNAAGGGDGASNNNNNNDENENNTNNETNNNEQDQVAEEPTADEMRAKRMARLAALEQNKSTAISNDGNGGTSGAKNAADATTPMDIDKPIPSVQTAPMEIHISPKNKLQGFQFQIWNILIFRIILSKFELTAMRANCLNGL